MAPRKLSIPLNYGSREKVSPKYAPFGVLKLGKNLRHREQGGLGMRNAYQAQPMTTRLGTLIAYDLHEYQGRLVALGSDTGEGFPSDVLEFNNLASERWTSCGGANRACHVSPFTNAREIGGEPLLEGGTQHADAASGGGFTCILSRSAGTQQTFAYIVDSRTNQTVSFEPVANPVFASFGGNVYRERVAFFGGAFYAIGVRVSDNSIRVIKLTPGTSVAWAALVTVDGANAALVTALDIVPVGNASTAAFVVAFDRGTSTSLLVTIWQANGTQLGGTITVAGTNSQDIALDADQTDNTIALLEAGGTTNLRTFTFAGALIAGPTATVTASAAGATLARIHNAASADTIIVGVNDASNNFSLERRNIDTHAILSTQVVGAFQANTRMLGSPGPAAFAPGLDGLVVGGLYQLQQKSVLGSLTPMTAALLYVTNAAVHAVTRDYVSADFQDPSTLSLDASMGCVCWVATHRIGIGTVKQASITLVDLKSTARTQAVNFGGLRYFAGATPWTYDGRIPTEAGFQEAPVIESIVTSNGAGFLTPLATYTYVQHWEYTWADGSFLESPPSLPVTVTLGAADNRATITSRAPHSTKVAFGSSKFGVTAVLVTSRTQWSPTTVDPASGVVGSPFSILRRALETSVPSGISNYGAQSAIIEGMSDAQLSSQAAIYTQAARGEFSGSLPHDAAESANYIAATSSHIMLAGLVRPFELELSKAAFLGQPFAFSALASFYTQAAAPIVGVFSLFDRRLIFTQNEILVLSAASPNDEGAGSVADPVRLSAPFGLKDWRSFVEEPGGLWFQLDDDKLYRLPSGGPPSWDGSDVQKTLISFPTITAATKHKADNVILFACNNAALTSARLMVRDLLFSTWFVDTPRLQAAKGIEALTSVGRAVAYLSGGVAYVQVPGSFADDGTTFIDCQATLEPVYPFGLGGYGMVYDLMLTAEYRGDCIVTINVSYDEGATFPFTVSFVASGLTSGARVQKRWALPQDVTASIMVDINVNTNGAPSEGIILNEVTLLVEEEPGKLKELDPADNA